MIEWVVSSSILIMIIIFLRFIFKGKISSRLQYALWALVLVRLLMPLSPFENNMSIMNVMPIEAEAQIESVGNFELGYLGYEIPDLSVTEPDSDLSIAEQNTQYNENIQELKSELESTNVENDYAITIEEILKLIWLVGIISVGLCLLISNLLFSIKLKKSRYKTNISNYRLPVYVSDAVETPCVFGLFRPVIYITSIVIEDEIALYHVLTHELTHNRHGDHIWAFLRALCLCIHWYNPLVWCAASLSRCDAELACDEGTIKRIGENERIVYGRTLIDLTCQKRASLLMTATTMTGSYKSFRERIKLIAKKPKMAVYTLLAILLAVSITVGCTFAGAKSKKETAFSPDTVSIDLDGSSDFIEPIKNTEIVDSIYSIYKSAIFDVKTNDDSFEKERAFIINFIDSVTGKDIRWTLDSDGTSQYGTDLQYYEVENGDDLYIRIQDILNKWEDSIITNEVDMDELNNIETEKEQSMSEVMYDFFNTSNGMNVTLNIKNEGVFNTYFINKERVEHILNNYKLIKLDALNTEKSDFWITISSADESKSVTFWSDNSGCMEYFNGENTTYWRTEAIHDGNGSIVDTILGDYYNLDVDYNRITFQLTESAESAAEFFVNNAFGTHLLNLVPGNAYGINEYDVVDWGVIKVSEDNSIVTGWMDYAFIPLDFDSPSIWAGNTILGEGKYEGWLTVYREFTIQQKEDGYWHCINLGTG